MSEEPADVPVGQLSEAHVQPVRAAEAAAGLRRRAAQTVHRGSAERHEEQLAARKSYRWREELEAPSDQHGAAAAVLHLEGLGGLHAANEAPLCRVQGKVPTLRRSAPHADTNTFSEKAYLLMSCFQHPGVPGQPPHRSAPPCRRLCLPAAGQAGKGGARVRRRFTTTCWDLVPTLTMEKPRCSSTFSDTHTSRPSAVVTKMKPGSAAKKASHGREQCASPPEGSPSRSIQAP